MKVLIASLYPYIYMLLYLIIPFDNYIRALPNILAILLVVFFPFVINKNDLKRVKKGPLMWFSLFLLSLFLIALLSGRIIEDFTVIKKVGIALGLVFLYLPMQNMQKISYAIIFSSLIAIVFSVVNMLIVINISEDIVLGYSRQVIEALLIDRLYLGLLSIFSILISYFSLKSKFHPNNRYHLVNIIINALFIILMLSRMGVLILLVLVVLRQLYGKYSWIRFPLALGILILLPALLFSSGSNRESKDPEGFLASTTTWEIRSKSWDCGWQLARDGETVITGMGVTNLKEALMACYEQITDPAKRERFLTNRYNLHNQFLDFYLSFGSITLFLLLIFIILILLKNYRHFSVMSFLFLLCSYFLIENVFHRQIGAYYIGFILIVLLTENEFSRMNKTNTKLEGS